MLLEGEWSLDKTKLTDEFSMEVRLPLLGLVVLSFLIGTPISCLVIINCIKEGIFQKPINCLIFYDELMALARSLTVLLFSEYLMTDLSWFSPGFCKAASVVSLVALGANLCTSCAIAVVRLLYIKLPFWVTSNSGAKITLVVQCAAITTTVILCLLWYSGPFPTPRFKDTICIGVGFRFAQLALDYSTANYSWGPGIATLWANVLVVSEFVSYLVLFVHLIRHDKAIKAILGLENSKKRLRGNVTQLTGHSIKFLLRLLWLLVAGSPAFISQHNYLVLQLFLWEWNYGLSGFLQAVTSPVLKQSIAKMVGSVANMVDQPNKDEGGAKSKTQPDEISLKVRGTNQQN